MALATSAAIALAGVAVSAGSAGMSFAQASKQNKRAKQAEQDAAKAMNEARKMFDVNYMKSLAIQKEPYELEREALLSQGAMAIQAGAESERGSAATAGRVQMAQNEAMAGQRTAMGKDLTDLELKTANEESRLRDIQANMSIGEAVGQQEIATEAQKARAAAVESGMASATSALQQGIQMIPLYTKTPSARIANRIEDTAMGTGRGDYGLSQADMQKSIASMGSVNNVDLSGVAKLNPNQYQAFMSGLDKNTLKQIQANMSTSMSSFNPNESPYSYSANPFSIFQ
jgi:hypothetical protein